jgi:hypothetical protein
MTMGMLIFFFFAGFYSQVMVRLMDDPDSLAWPSRRSASLCANRSIRISGGSNLTIFTNVTNDVLQ